MPRTVIEMTTVIAMNQNRFTPTKMTTHPLDHLPDLRLTTIFPLRSVTLMPAASVCSFNCRYFSAADRRLLDGAAFLDGLTDPDRFFGLD